MTKREEQRIRKALEGIAAKHLDIETLETRKSDSLDFHEVAVWGLKAALEAAYRAGQNAAEAKPAKHEVIRADGRKVRVSIPQDDD